MRITRKNEAKLVAEQLRYMAKSIEDGKYIPVAFQMQQMIDRKFTKKETIFTASGLVLSIGVRYKKTAVSALANPVKKGKK